MYLAILVEDRNLNFSATGHKGSLSLRLLKVDCLKYKAETEILSIHNAKMSPMEQFVIVYTVLFFLVGVYT
jgi:hypothetical protein